eukprot:COSAG05_NODE_19884_length_286_cov_1.090909_1_plen_75_part_01
MLEQTQQWQQQQAEYGYDQDQDQDQDLEGEVEPSFAMDDQVMQQVAQQDHVNDFQEQGMEMHQMVAQLNQRQRTL